MIREFIKPVSHQSVYIGPTSKENCLIFGIETSCDETSASVVLNGRKVLSNIISSQIDTHKIYGGVVPEVAARMHLEAINEVITEAKEAAGIKMENITAFCSTAGPGLVGALLVGTNAAKTLSMIYDKPFIAANHLNAHVCANYLNTDLEPPFICLLISGGHTMIMKVNDYNNQEILGETLDDAVGEAYDKTARLLGLPYPGGIQLDKLAQSGDKTKFKFTEAKTESKYDFSFSGLKTAALRLIKSFEVGSLPIEDISAGFQQNVSETLLKKTLRAANDYGINKIALAGGVAANSEIRRKFFDLKNQGFEIYVPEIKYCTDNAAMVASCAYFLSGISDELDIEVFSR
jgi:N6-L-threonylcarbamoyladenine synthase